MGPGRRLGRWAALALVVAALVVLSPAWELPAFLVARYACPQLRWSLLLCPGLKAWADVRLQSPMEGISAEVYCPGASTPADLLTTTAWVDGEAPAIWWHPRPREDLAFLGSRVMGSPTGMPGTQTALWGQPGAGVALVLDAEGFGPVCGASEAGWQEFRTPEWMREHR